MSPRASTSNKENTRAVLIETGINIMLEKGFNNTGLSDVLNACGVPKGSFYYYFQSKEDFGLQIINSFDEEYADQLDKVFSNRQLTAVDRLKRFIDEAISNAEQRKCSRGCLIANLSQEMADQNEVFRTRLKEVIEKRRSTFALVIQEAKDKEEICSDIDPREAAEFFLSAFEGAIMRSKVRKDTEPLLSFRKMIFSVVLQAK